jgi:hypothetical protein
VKTIPRPNAVLLGLEMVKNEVSEEHLKELVKGDWFSFFPKKLRVFLGDC